MAILCAALVFFLFPFCMRFKFFGQLSFYCLGTMLEKCSRFNAAINISNRRKALIFQVSKFLSYMCLDESSVCKRNVSSSQMLGEETGGRWMEGGVVGWWLWWSCAFYVIEFILCHTHSCGLNTCRKSDMKQWRPACTACQCCDNARCKNTEIIQKKTS